MLRIRTLGGLWVERDGRRIEISSPRRSALLAVLAAAGDHGVSRDRLLLWLWPDATEERGRRSLSQAVYVTSKHVGADIAVASGAHLLLAPTIQSDVAELLAAQAAGDLATVIDRYQGPFLDGFVLSDAVEFDEWVSGERRRLEEIARQALERLVSADPTAPASRELWRRLAAIDPLATSYAVALARATAAGGDPGSAIRLLRSHQQYLRAETGAATPEEVTRLLADLAAAPVATAETPPNAGSPDPAASPVALPARPRAPRFGRRSKVAVGVVSLALLVAVVATRGRVAKPLRDGATVVLTDVDNQTPDSTLGPALTLAAAVGLQQSPGFSVYPRARLAGSLRLMGRTIRDTMLSEGLAREIALREGGKAIVTLSVAPLGNRLVLASKIVEPSSGLALVANSETVDSVPGLLTGLDRLMGWVRRQLGDAGWERAAPLPRVTTPSLVALRAFAEAQAAFSRGDNRATILATERALVADTGFAMAHAFLGTTFVWANQVSRGLPHFREANARRDRLTEPEQLSLDIALARAEGRLDDVITTTRTRAARFPSVFAWYNYGEALRNADRDTAAAIEAFGRALALDSTFAEAHRSMALAKASQGDLRGALDAYDRLWRVDSTLLLRDFNNQQWGGVLVQAGQFARAESVFRKMLPRDSTSRARGYRSLAYLAFRRGRAREAIEHLGNALRLYPARSLSSYRDLLLLASAHRVRGDIAGANRAIDRALEVFRTVEIEAGFLLLGGHQLILSDRLAEARVVLDTMKRRAALRPDHPQDQAALAILQAELALARDRPEEALAFLGGARPDFLEPFAEGIVIDALASINRHDSALALGRAAVANLPFANDALLDAIRTFIRLGRIAEAAGDSATARTAYSALIEHWKDGDQDLPMLVTARRELLRLKGPGSQ
ncbi:MAG: BTAD domain-containing putative transcriptional regulator [Gemmatimonadales bacterium]